MKPYCCPYCDYKSDRSDKLGDHIRGRHTGERPYKCDQCDYSAAIKLTLKRHKQTHKKIEKVTPKNAILHKCPHCDYKSDKLSNLKGRIRVHTG